MRIPDVDPKDQIAHLRRVHSSLVVICFGLFAMTFLGRPRGIEEAIAQLDEVQALIDRWEPRWLEARVDAIVADRALVPAPRDELEADCRPCRERVPGATPAEGLRFSFQNTWTPLPLPPEILSLAATETTDPADRTGPLWARRTYHYMRRTRTAPPEPRRYQVGVLGLVFEPPENLEQLERLWDDLASVSLRIAYPNEWPPERFGFYNRENVIQTRHWLRAASEHSWPRVDVRFEPTPENVQGHWLDFMDARVRPAFHYVGFSPWGQISIPISHDEIVVEAQAAFAEHFALDWRRGSFALNVPELTSATIDSAQHGFDKVLAVLERRRAESEGRIDLFGAKIRVVDLAAWASPIVLALQFYLLLHLRGLRASLTVAKKIAVSPWIGIYRDAAARVTTVATALALPAALIGFFTVLEFRKTPILVVPLALSLAVAAWSYRELRRVWTLERQADPT